MVSAMSLSSYIAANQTREERPINNSRLQHLLGHNMMVQYLLHTPERPGHQLQPCVLPNQQFHVRADLDVCRTDNNQEVEGIYYQIIQATSLQNSSTIKKSFAFSRGLWLINRHAFIDHHFVYLVVNCQCRYLLPFIVPFSTLLLSDWSLFLPFVMRIS